MAGKPIRSRVGSFSSAGAIAKADGRSREAQILRRAIDALTAQLGGNPTAAQSMLIEAASIAYLRMRCTIERYKVDEPHPEGLDDHLTKMISSLRKTLLALGLEASKGPAISLAEYLEHRKAG